MGRCVLSCLRRSASRPIAPKSPCSPVPLYGAMSDVGFPSVPAFVARQGERSNRWMQESLVACRASPCGNATRMPPSRCLWSPPHGPQSDTRSDRHRRRADKEHSEAALTLCAEQPVDDAAHLAEGDAWVARLDASDGTETKPETTHSSRSCCRPSPCSNDNMCGSATWLLGQCVLRDGIDR
jgi:hypothetical protein